MRHKTKFINPAEGALTVFTDGASLTRPRRGGVGVRFVYSDKLGEETVWELDEPGYLGATSNQMELQAVITALKEIRGARFRTDLLAQSRRIDVYTDSLYVVENLFNAASVWPKNGWMTLDGPPVSNVELWKDLVREWTKVRQIKRVEILWAKGHSADNPHNKAVDKLAKESAQRAVRPPLAPVTVRRRTTSTPLEKGSVKMLGQKLTIRIVRSQLFKTQGLHKYTYEVMSRRSPFFGKTDEAFSTDGMMRAAHTYRVTVNDDQLNPMIVKRHLEVVTSRSKEADPGAD